MYININIIYFHFLYAKILGKHISLSTLSLSAAAAHRLQMSKSYSQPHHHILNNRPGQKHKVKPTRADSIYRDETETLLQQDEFTKPPPPYSASLGDSFTSDSHHSLSPLLSQSQSFSPLNTPPSHSPVRGKYYNKYYYQHHNYHQHPPKPQSSTENTAKSRLKKLLLKATYYGNLTSGYNKQNQSSIQQQYDSCSSSSDPSLGVRETSATSHNPSSSLQQKKPSKSHENFEHNSSAACAVNSPKTKSKPEIGSPLHSKSTTVIRGNDSSQVTASGAHCTVMKAEKTSEDNSTTDNTFNNVDKSNTCSRSSLDNRPLGANLSTGQTTDEENNIKAKIGGLSIDSDISFIDGD